ncbi:uncharacterized protein EAE98_010632 [Botrytis deweyae]|uniref:Myb-like domain-containing protein n=1 Tax=Botrytis deweyae TaxID=2478750 RepID=A0ABQ7I8E2_9HELO|nr:uncharacterized protein EAE98_010632 [Botrytis deweyae]KAF7916623.1 hypothetical protein EAE98_010632 [Botrytis deweyae]
MPRKYKESKKIEEIEEVEEREDEESEKSEDNEEDESDEGSEEDEDDEESEEDGLEEEEDEDEEKEEGEEESDDSEEGEEADDEEEDDEEENEEEQADITPMTADQIKIATNFDAREPTAKDAKFLWIVLDCIETPPDINWNLVAERSECSNSYMARSRFGQMRTQFRKNYKVEPQPLIPKITGMPPPDEYDDPPVLNSKKKVLTDPAYNRLVRRKAVRVGNLQNIDPKKPSKFKQNRGQGYTLNRNNDTAANLIITANQRHDYDSENEFQNKEEFDLSKYHGFDEETNTLTVSDQGSDDEIKEAAPVVLDGLSHNFN